MSSWSASAACSRPARWRSTSMCCGAARELCLELHADRRRPLPARSPGQVTLPDLSRQRDRDRADPGPRDSLGQGPARPLQALAPLPSGHRRPRSSPGGATGADGCDRPGARRRAGPGSRPVTRFAATYSDGRSAASCPVEVTSTRPAGSWPTAATIELRYPLAEVEVASRIGKTPRSIYSPTAANAKPSTTTRWTRRSPISDPIVRRVCCTLSRAGCR